MFLSVDGHHLQLRVPDTSLGINKVATPAVHVIDLVGTELSVRGPTSFRLKTSSNKKFGFVTPDMDECNQWLYKFQRTPGMYR